MNKDKCKECTMRRVRCKDLLPNCPLTQMAAALRAAVVENVRKQGLITDEDAAEILDSPLSSEGRGAGKEKEKI